VLVPVQLRPRSDADGPAFLAWRGGDDFHRRPYRIPRHEQRSLAWFVGVFPPMVYLVFAMTTLPLPPRVQ